MPNKRMPAVGDGMRLTRREADPKGSVAWNGRYRSDLVAGHPRGQPAVIGKPRPAAIFAPALDHRVLDVPAIDRHRRLSHHLPRVLFDLSVDAEQGADPLYRPFQFHLPDVARRVLDGGGADRDLRDHRGTLQSADWAHYRPSHQQPAGQGPAQMARHDAGAMGHSARAVVTRLVVAVRSDPFG